MLSVEGLDLHYGDAQALAGVTLDVPQGATVAIVGANGAGKTSLIRAISGMLKPSAGRIRFKGEDITGKPSHVVCNLGLGQVAEGRQVFPSLTVRENLFTGAMLPRASARKAQNYERMLELFPRLSGYARPGALLVLSGVLLEQAREVQALYQRDFEDFHIRTDNGWAVVTARRKAH